MNKIIKINNRYEILHTHRNFQRETDFVAYDTKTDMPVDAPEYRMIRKPNCLIDWSHPLEKNEINYLIGKEI